MRSKPVIFISHASVDEKLAVVIGEQIRNVLGVENVDVFVSTEALRKTTGANWFKTVISYLNEADILVLLVTHSSLQSKWVWFELGYFWSKLSPELRDSGEKVYPLRVSELQVTELNGPIVDLQLQVNSLGDRDVVSSFFHDLCKKYQGGMVEKLAIDAVTNAALLDEQYHLSDEESEIKLEDFLNAEKEKTKSRSFIDALLRAGPESGSIEHIKKYEDYFMTGLDIFSGKSIDYVRLDKELGFLPNTSKRLLKKVAARYYLVPQRETEHTVKFKVGYPSNVE
jgi:hypothetical protein